MAHLRILRYYKERTSITWVNLSNQNNRWFSWTVLWFAQIIWNFRRRTST